MRSVPRWAAMLLLLLAMLACGNPEVVLPTTSATATPPAAVSAGASQPVYKLGFLASLSGPNANEGVSAEAAAELAANELNASGGIAGHKLQLIVEDDGGDPSQAITGLKTIANQNAVAVVGPTTSAAAVALMPVEGEASLPAMSLAADEAQFEPTQPFVYGVAPLPSLVAAGLLSYLQKTNVHAIALIRETTAYGMAGMKQLQEQGGRFGVRIVVDETYGLHDTDLSRQLGNVKNNSSVDGVVVWASARTGPPAVITRQFHQTGLTVPLLLTVDQADPAFLGTAAEAAEGVILEVPKPVISKYLLTDDPSRQALADFVAAYKQRTGKDPDRYAAMAYDAVNIVSRALAVAGDAPDHLTAQLNQTKYDGVAGPYAFSPTAHAGLQSGGLAIATVRNGAFVPVQPNCDGCARTANT